MPKNKPTIVQPRASCEAQSLPAEMLSEEEIEFIESLAAAHSKHGHLTPEELTQVVQWALKTRVSSTCLEMVLAGMLVLTWDRDSLEVRFSLTSSTPQA